MNQNLNMETRVALLEKDMGQVSNLLDKLDSTIESIERLTHSLSSGISLHELKLGDSERTNKDIVNLVETRRVEAVNNNNMVHDRLNTYIKENAERHEKFEKDLNNSINSMRTCMSESNNKFRTELRDELKELSKSRNIILGIGLAIITILNLLPTIYNWLSTTGVPVP